MKPKKMKLVEYTVWANDILAHSLNKHLTQIAVDKNGDVHGYTGVPTVCVGQGYFLAGIYNGATFLCKIDPDFDWQYSVVHKPKIRMSKESWIRQASEICNAIHGMKYATVDQYGTVSLFSTKPVIRRDTWYLGVGSYGYQIDLGSVNIDFPWSKSLVTVKASKSAAVQNCANPLAYGEGWWGHPGEDNHKIKVHAVRDGKPICGTRVHGSYQWCVPYGERKHPCYVECRHCLKLLEKERAKK